MQGYCIGFHYHNKKNVFISATSANFKPMGKHYTDNRHPIAVRFDAEQLAKIEQAAKATGLAKQDVIRLCLSIGLEKLRRVDFNLPAAVLDQAGQKPNFIREGGLLLREDPVKPKAKNK
jgi:predicted DNA binding CopG/RHH family protein